MDLYDIYQTCNYISNKHKSGNAFTINQFNSLVELINTDFLKKKVEESGYFEGGRLDYNNPVRSSKIVGQFVEYEDGILLSDTPVTSAYPIFVPIGMHVDNTAREKIDIISEEEFHDRYGDSVIGFGVSTQSLAAVFRDGGIYVYGADALPALSEGTLSYYRYPVTPFLDYYIDVNGVIQYLDVGDTHVWATGEIDSDGDAHTLGDANWASLTTELEYSIDYHMDILNEILSRVGIRLKEPQLTQYAEAMKAEQKQM